MSSIVFIYKKEKSIKVLDMSNQKEEHTKLINEGYTHTSTLNAMVWLQYQFDNCKDPMDIYCDFIELIHPSHFKK